MSVPQRFPPVTLAARLRLELHPHLGFCKGLRLLFARELFTSETVVLAHARQSGTDVLIERAHFSLRLEHTALDDLQHSGLIGII